MLKALELVGFKSFADKTRFEFHEGITVVVGPNGSGKSNVVDAIKWVLGSQSAKSLRGSEMTDVIFNGSGSRGALNTAEVTLVLDNQDGSYGGEARGREVAITRRVYRSGEGEYLINGGPCRLRDIRDLLAGTGIGTEAYSIIEQGKVDALLQASPRDRRAIFEEAAGISRFRAKRQDAARRLARVEQNLLRLSDIVDEVESRLRSIRMQAGKAQRYREGVKRLKDLRTQIGIADWLRLSERIDNVAGELSNFAEEDTSRRDWIEAAERELPKLDQALRKSRAESEQIERQLTGVRENMVSCQATLNGLAARQGDLEANITLLEDQWRAANTLKSPDTSDTESLAAKLSAARSEYDDATRELADNSERCHEQATRVERLTAQVEELTRRLQATDNRLELTQQKLETVQEKAADTTTQSVNIRQELAASTATRLELIHTVAASQELHRQVDQQARSSEQQLAVARQSLAENERRLAELRREYQRVETELQSNRHRVELIGELDREHHATTERVRSFVRQSLEIKPQVVADVLHVDVDTAPIIEAALGVLAEYVVVPSSAKLLERAETLPPGARIMCLDWRVPVAALDQVDLSRESGVWGRADQFVDSQPTHHTLVRRLLGRTWIVDSLRTAFRLAMAAGQGLHFVTADGDVLGADGTLLTGQRDQARSAFARRRHLDQLRARLAEVTPQAERLATELAQLEDATSTLQNDVDRAFNENRAILGRAAEIREQLAADTSRLQSVTERCEELTDRESKLATESKTLDQSIANTEVSLAMLTQQREQLATTCAQVRQQLSDAIAEHATTHDAITRQKITIEKLAHQVELLTATVAQAATDSRSMEIRAELNRQRETLRQRVCFVERERLELSALVAELASQLERLTPQRKQLANCRKQLQRSVDTLQQKLQVARRHIDDTQSRRSQLEVALAKLEHQRQSLADRLQEDYEIDLAAVAATVSGERPEIDRRQVEQEINQIRDGLHRIGAVNVDALEELDEIESRFESISAQYNDLSQAKASLERLMAKLNTESRQMFLTTVETVRGHFQELFRRLFGGGEADILLEEYESEDAMDCGVEIRASPPGKDTKTISLLSGGEKTMTCVALLLAMFRSKPSPFCVLDEVDAALDEANVGRFTGVLSDFLSNTQFVVITHSKKTMTGADTLYGVTMQESGVSKQVSVRFDDVTDDGFIKPTAGRTRQQPPPAAKAA